jgi:hypothetical protein
MKGMINVEVDFSTFFFVPPVSEILLKIWVDIFSTGA